MPGSFTVPSRFGPAQHTAFSVPVAARGVDLRDPPFAGEAKAWTSSRDYSATQSFAQAARAAEIEAIFYHSVRDPAPAWCAAILTPRAFAAKRPDNARQTWQLVVTQQEVIWRRGAGETLSFATSW
jgi:hypothetical protein